MVSSFVFLSVWVGYEQEGGWKKEERRIFFRGGDLTSADNRQSMNTKISTPFFWLLDLTCLKT